ncbi:hypothetical protein JMJ35_008211 [Cladonia borealis]|uniref:LIM zinc-binding domain-containing protein n=1 Tax=Cladonia borealis TaxID=184061 RepID=A0AA39UZJ7_9LECA|nr:hypothetical protein JMJ35_008211 [Cladonia borealis]
MSLLHRKAVHEQHRVEATSTTAMKSEQAGPRSAPVNGPRRRSSGLKFFAPSTTTKPEAARDSHKAWEAAYLKDLRSNRPARPGGSRPLPGRASTTTPEPYARASSAMSFRPSCSTRQPELSVDRGNERCASAMSHRRAQSDMPTADLHGGGIGRSLTPQLVGSATSGDSSGADMASESPQTIPEIAYRESGMRWMEKQEARSLREALEDMDVRDEARIHAAARAEASELVLKHRSQGIPYRNPDRAYNYRQHLEKGAHARSQSLGWNVGPAAATNGHVPGQRSSSDGSNSSKGDSNPSQESQTTSISTAESAFTGDGTQLGREGAHALSNWPQKKAYMGLASESPTIRSGRRRSSGPRARDVSGGLFRNPDDRIYEEPDEMKVESPIIKSEESRIPAPLAMKPRNTVATTTQPSFRPRVAFADEKQRLHRSEIHRNPPSQSRDPSYKRNGAPDTPPDPALGNIGDFPSDRPATRDGKEIRSDDIRSATSMRRKDRSPKLPSPTVVSDRPGRPIVSFDRNWVPHDTDKQVESEPERQSVIPHRPRFKPRMPESTVSAPVVPIINLPDAPSIQINDVPGGDSNPIPSISVSEAPLPTISLPDDPPKRNPLRDPGNWSRPSPANRPLPHHSATTPVHSSKLHWTPSPRRATAQCAACALPIEGRIVSAASQRFHPHCFTCHHCSEALECVAFYPEPDSARDARLARIEARANGTELLEDDKPGETAADDGDASLRFYCHLDYHELFSPRCRSCKTPIETEVVLACGGSWHVGHFFCAECGDPFDAKTPFVERDGYAWCVGCHAGRFSGKCRGCRKPVVDGGVSAVGGEWHVECFCCVECGGQFDDGRFFTRGDDDEKPVCVRCEERRLKA